MESFVITNTPYSKFQHSLVVEKHYVLSLIYTHLRKIKARRKYHPLKRYLTWDKAAKSVLTEVTQTEILVMPLKSEEWVSYNQNISFKNSDS